MAMSIQTIFKECDQSAKIGKHLEIGKYIFASGQSVNALVAVGILAVFEGFPVADLLDMTAIVLQIDRNNAVVTMHVWQAYWVVVYLGLTVAAASVF